MEANQPAPDQERVVLKWSDGHDIELPPGKGPDDLARALLQAGLADDELTLTVTTVTEVTYRLDDDGMVVVAT